jgi:hypothetical protein
MDPVTMTFYGLICGVLAAFAPNLGHRWARAVWGLLIGGFAAFVLPFIRTRLGV